MKHRIFAVALSTAALIAAYAPSASAIGTATKTFTVDATLVPTCTMTAFSGNINFGTYTADSAAVTPAAITSTVTCSRGLTGMTFQLDDNGTTQTSGAAHATTVAAEGLMAGNNLRYTLAATMTAFAGSSAATGGSGGSVGAGQSATVSIAGTLPQQWGNCAAASCAGTQQIRTVTVNY